MAGGRYDPGVTEPASPALALDGLEAVVFDHLTPDRLRVRMPASCPAPVRIGVRGEVVELAPGTTRESPC